MSRLTVSVLLSWAYELAFGVLAGWVVKGKRFEAAIDGQG